MLLNYVVLRALWKIDVYLISTLVNKEKENHHHHYHHQQQHQQLQANYEINNNISVSFVRES